MTEYPAGAVLMCMRVADSHTVFADSKRCPCADCGEEIHHRPYVPDHVTKLCVACAAKRMTVTEAKGEPVVIATTERALDEARLFFSKTGRKQ